MMAMDLENGRADVAGCWSLERLEGSIQSLRSRVSALLYRLDRGHALYRRHRELVLQVLRYIGAGT